MTDVKNRFWDKVDRFGKCWNWTACKNHGGYGSFKVAGRKQRAHRVAWEMANGPIPDGLHVLHRCDNPGCVNPDHLFLGTPADNTADMVSKGRGVTPPHLVGETNGQAKLTEADIIAIRADPRTQREIASDYGISRTSVSSIQHRQRWRHVG